MKKLFISIITTLLLITSTPAMTIMSEEVGGETATALSPEVIKELQKLAAQGDTSFINSIQSVVGMFTTVGSVFTSYNGIVNFLKSIGVLESSESIQRETLVKIEGLQDSINDMNAKLDGIVEQLEKNFAEVSLNFDDVKVRLDKQNISAFNTDYESKMVNRLSNFENTMQSKIKTWYTSNKENITLSLSYKQLKNNKPICGEDAKISDAIINEAIEDKTKNLSVCFDADLLNTVFANAVWNNETYEADINERMENYYVSSLDTALKEWTLRYLNDLDIIVTTNEIYESDTTIDTAYEVTFAEAIATNKDNIKKDFAINFSQALMNNFYLQICEEGKGTTSQYVNEVCNEFRNYCNQLVDSSASPYINQLDILPKIYLFQKETKDIVNDLRTYYISNLTKYAIFYLGVMAACDIPDYNGYVNLYNKTIENIAECFDNFLVKDGDNVIDNYCYVVNAPIEFKECKLTENVKVYHEQYSNKMFGIDYEVYNGYSASPWVFNESNENIVGNQDMLKISALYKYLRDQDETLSIYLQNNMYGQAKDTLKNLNTIVTNYQGGKNFNLSEKLLLEVGIGGIGRSTYFPQETMWQKRVNDGNPSEISDDGFVVHDSAIADTFDMSNLSLSVNNKLESRALFAKHSSWWTKDEMCFFFSKNLSNSIQDVKTSSKDGHDFYTATMSTTDFYYVIRKNNSLSETQDEHYIDCNNLDDASELVINNVASNYYKQNDLDKSYSMYYDEENYLTGDIDKDTLKQGFIDYINKEETKNSMLQYNNNKVDAIKAIDVFKDGYYDVDLSEHAIDKIINKLNEVDKKDADIEKVMPALPSINDNCKLIVSIIYYPIFKIDKDDSSYYYSKVDAFILRPYLTWDNGNKFIEITDSILNQLGITLNVKIPAFGKEEGMNRANINHYDNKYNILEPIEVIKGKVKGDYIEFRTNSFSPFTIESYYYEVPYVPAKTGIN